MQSENTADLSTALAKAQAAMKAIPFDRVNSHFKSEYASLASVIDTVRKPLADNALSYTQTTEIREGCLVLVTTLRHSTGQWVSSEYPLPSVARPQDLGSALTYARRYSLSALACIAADDDDDAEGAKTNGQVASAPKPKPSVLQPQTVHPPVNPATGELGPHEIIAPDATAMQWAALFLAAIEASRDDDELEAWKLENTAKLHKLRDKAPKIADSVRAAIISKQESFKREAA